MNYLTNIKIIYPLNKHETNSTAHPTFLLYYMYKRTRISEKFHIIK
ncbi:hypothetical protein T190115A13A_90052 [Tenacibaculum sp. 190524A02b]|uniref:Uncharacterized protein n=1 Tax=Tenacibaculum vairaonense TaxID=3137860 RepID=A0ABM9PSB2_9FLAO